MRTSLLTCATMVLVTKCLNGLRDIYHKDFRESLSQGAIQIGWKAGVPQGSTVGSLLFL